MPIIKSAKKRVRVARKATVRNARTKRNLKDAIKSLQTSLDGNKKNAPERHAAAQSAIGRAAKKHVIHKNKAARKQRQLAKAAKAAGVNTASAAKKTATATKVTPKKTPAAKKPVAKKTAAKKPVAKK
jgi:small subunit ribosomal protein S20